MPAGDLFLYPRLEERLLLMEHLVEFSELPVIFLGPQGSGKTAVAERLADPEQHPHWQPVLVEGSARLTQRQVLPFLYEALDLGSIPPGGADTQLSAALTALRQRFAYLRHVRRLPVLVIDDADLLDNDALALLIRIAETGGARLLLLAESGLALTPADESVGKGQPHQLDLPPLAREDMAAFVDHLRKAGALNMPTRTALDEGTLLEMHESAGGRPGALLAALDQCAAAAFKDAAPAAADRPRVTGSATSVRRLGTRVLAPLFGLAARLARPIRQRTLRIVDTDAVDEAGASSGTPRRPGAGKLMGGLGIAGGLLAIALVGLWVNHMMSGGGGTKGTSDRAADKDSAGGPRLLSLPPAETLRLPKAGEGQNEVDALTEPPAPELPVPFEPEVLVGEPAASVVSEPDPGRQTLEEADLLPAKPEPLRPLTTRPGIAARSAPSATDPAAGPAEPATTAVPAAPAATAVPAQPPAPRPPKVAEPRVFSAAGPAQPAGTYLIQLLGSRDPATIERFVAGLNVSETVYVARTTHLGEPWFIVLIGAFEGRSEASEAVSNLPDSLKKTQPWPRAVESLSEADLRQIKR